MLGADMVTDKRTYGVFDVLGQVLLSSMVLKNTLTTKARFEVFSSALGETVQEGQFRGGYSKSEPFHTASAKKGSADHVSGGIVPEVSF